MAKLIEILRNEGEPSVAVVTLRADELGLLESALDSHVYWQLSDTVYRNDGYVREPGADDPDTVEEIEASRELESSLNEIARELVLPS